VAWVAGQTSSEGRLNLSHSLRISDWQQSKHPTVIVEQPHVFVALVKQGVRKVTTGLD